jgi:hypothetical protein
MGQTCERKAAFIDQVMRAQISGRELDDVGETVLSYAEVKALATGNPLVIEQAGIQADIAKLERLAAAHRSDQRRLDTIARNARAEIDSFRRLEADYTAALERRTDTTGDRFRIELAGGVHTSRVDAGKVLLQKARDLIHEVARRQTGGETRVHTLGHLAGFPLTGYALKVGGVLEARLGVDLGESAIELRLTPDEVQTKRPDVIVTSLEGHIRKLDDKRAEAQRQAADAEKRAASAQARRGTPFPEQGRLDRLRHRYQEILDELKPDEDPPPESPPLESPHPPGPTTPGPDPPGLG